MEGIGLVSSHFPRGNLRASDTVEEAVILPARRVCSGIAGGCPGDWDWGAISLLIVKEQLDLTLEEEEGAEPLEERGWSQHPGGGADVTGAQPEVQVRTDRWGVLLARRIPSLLCCPGLSSSLGSRWQSRTAPPPGQPAPFPMRIPSFIFHILTRFSIGGETQSHFNTTGGISGPG